MADMHFSGPVFLCLLCSALAGQDDAVVHWSQAAITVAVDFSVADANGRLITDLTPQDILILEDDIPQTVDRLLFFSPEGAGRSAVADRTDGSPSSAGGATRRTYAPSRPVIQVFLLDYSTVAPERRPDIAAACRRYFQDQFAEGDLAAVIVLDTGIRLVQPLTAEREALISAFEDLSRGLTFGADGRLLSMVVPPRGMTRSLAHTDGSTQSLERALNSTELVLQADLFSVADRPSDSLERQWIVRTLQSFLTMKSDQDRRQTISILRLIDGVSAGLAGLDGRKAIIVFTEGFVVGGETEREFHQTVQLAIDRQTPIYCVDASGLAPVTLSPSLAPQGELASISSLATGRIAAHGGESLFDRAKKTGTDIRETAMRYLAGATGGKAVRNTNDLAGAVREISRELHSYYLAVYRPSRQELDGGYRRLRLAVRGRPELRLRHRLGYRAIPAGYEALTPGEYLQLREIEEGRFQTTMRLFARADVFDTGLQRPNVLVSIEVPFADLGLSPGSEVSRSTAELAFVGVVRDSDGFVADAFRQPVALTVSGDQAAATKRPRASAWRRASRCCLAGIPCWCG